MADIKEFNAIHKRIERDILLRETVDRINPIRWEIMTESEKEAWRKYRQALLDLPEQGGFPFDVVYPTKPE